MRQSYAALPLKRKEVISWNYFEKLEKPLKLQKLLATIFFCRNMNLILLKKMKTEFINLAVNFRVIKDDSETFQCLP